MLQLGRRVVGEHATLLSLMLLVASQSIPTWNQIIDWLKEMESLDRLLHSKRVDANQCQGFYPLQYWNNTEVTP